MPGLRKADHTSLTRNCNKCKLDIAKEYFCSGNARCNACVYQRKKAYFVEYYKTHREEMIQNELIKYQEKRIGVVNQKRGRKKKVIIEPVVIQPSIEPGLTSIDRDQEEVSV